MDRAPDRHRRGLSEGRSVRIALVNPNTSAATTAAMTRIAQEAAGDRATVSGLTAPFGAPLIVEPRALDVAARAVAALGPALSDADAVIVAAFGDPGLDALREILPVPVTGLAEAGMAEAAAGGRRFGVVTTTPALVARIAASAARHGFDRFVGTWTTPGDPAALTADPVALLAALAEGCRRAVDEGRLEAVVIGGGPLAEAARALAPRCPAPLIAPLPAAVRRALSLLGEAG
jgi:Asp/Glu/hydantoin racemase